MNTRSSGNERLEGAGYLDINQGFVELYLCLVMGLLRQVGAKTDPGLGQALV